jgi:hypothetical protein
MVTEFGPVIVQWISSLRAAALTPSNMIKVTKLTINPTV